MTATTAIHGYAAAGFEEVEHEFGRNFAERAELGASFAAYRDQELVVDLWGGVADRSSARPWSNETLGVIFSGTKPLVATCLLILIDTGRLHLDRPVANYWPEFAAGGKEEILVSQLVSHTAGLPAVRNHLSVADLVHDQRIASLLAAQEPLVPPDRELCYHGLTFGWLCGEVLRRVDGRSVGRFFAEEVAAPLELEAWIGLPREQEARVATLVLSPGWDSASLTEGADGAGSLAERIWANPSVFAPERFPWNSRQFHAAEIPAVGGIANARSIARLNACLARGGEIDGVRLLSEAAVRLGTTALASGNEYVTHAPMSVGVGFQLQTEALQFGPWRDAFGHAGVGGSIHGASPSARLGFSYVMNLMADGSAPDSRPRALLGALARSVTPRPSRRS